MFEYKKFPFYGTQFHPEKVLFEWILPEIGRTPIFRLISKRLSHFFINECKKNKNRVKVPDLYIRNYNLWSRSATIKKINPNQKLFKDNHSAFENSYKVLTKKTTFEKLMDTKDKFGIKAIMIYDPSEEPNEDVWDDVIYYYEDLEEYERCAELLKLKNKIFDNV